jgi:hypothetical protein
MRSSWDRMKRGQLGASCGSCINIWKLNTPVLSELKHAEQLRKNEARAAGGQLRQLYQQLVTLVEDLLLVSCLFTILQLLLLQCLLIHGQALADSLLYLSILHKAIINEKEKENICT